MKTDFSGFNINPEEIVMGKRPFFHDLKPDFKQIEEMAAKYEFDNLIIIGNGGAVNSFKVLHQALYDGDKSVEIIGSMEPYWINQLKKKYQKDSTLVIVSSTSGTNVGVLEIMSQFLDYDMVVITAENEAPLRKIALEQKIPRLYVPHITDRYLTSGSMAYFPLQLLGIDIRKIDSALHTAYDDYCRKDSAPYLLSSILFMLEKKGYSEVFTPLYSVCLSEFPIYIMQLMHESASKNGKGQTYLVVNAPESQHHTNQRFFGGQKNICGLFIKSSQEDTDSKVSLPKATEHFSLRDGTVADINNVRLSDAFDFEFQGTYKDALDNSIPSGFLELEKIDEESVAELIAFWHYMAVYSSWVRGVDPFDQPQVEKSKEIAFEMRRNA